MASGRPCLLSTQLYFHANLLSLSYFRAWTICKIKVHAEWNRNPLCIQGSGVSVLFPWMVSLVKMSFDIHRLHKQIRAIVA